MTPAAVATGVRPERNATGGVRHQLVGSDPDAGVTVAVNLTSCPNTDAGTVLVTPTAIAATGAPPTRPSPSGWKYSVVVLLRTVANVPLKELFATTTPRPTSQ